MLRLLLDSSTFEDLLRLHVRRRRLLSDHQTAPQSTVNAYSSSRRWLAAARKVESMMAFHTTHLIGV